MRVKIKIIFVGFSISLQHIIRGKTEIKSSRFFQQEETTK